MKRYTVKDILAQYTENDVINHAKKYHQTYRKALQAFKAGAELTVENYKYNNRLFTNEFPPGDMYLKMYGDQLNLFDEKRLINSYYKAIKQGRKAVCNNFKHCYPSLFYFVVKA